MIKNQSKIMLFLVLLVAAMGIQIPLFNQEPRCMILEASFQPIKVQIVFPKIPNKIQGEKFMVQLYEYMNSQKQLGQFVNESIIYRKNLKLQHDKLYAICIQLVSDRDFEDDPVYVGYTATQDFQSLIGKIQIPQQLQKQKNLKTIYTLAKKMSNLNKEIIGYQNKQRKLEDELTLVNLNKNERIISLTLLECFVIVLSGLYQIFALRRFLIEKNLY